MGVLFIDKRGITLDVRDGCLQLRAEGRLLQSVPAGLVERVVLRADVSVSSAALAELGARGIGLVAMGGRTGAHAAFLVGAPAKEVRTRIAQCHASTDEAFATRWCALLVRGRLRGQTRLLERVLDGRPDLRKPMTDALGTLGTVTARLAGATDRPTLRGLEGAGAAAFFGAYTRAFAPALGFERRRRRPPPDPVNVALSLGYTLLTGEAVKACWAAGLDPAIGLLHMPAHGRPGLACDLVEPWRGHVEGWVWELFRSGELRDAHFGRDGAGACLLGKAGRERYYQAWAPRRRRLAVGLRRHARLVAAGLLRRADALGMPLDDEEDG